MEINRQKILAYGFGISDLRVDHATHLDDQTFLGRQFVLVDVGSILRPDDMKKFNNSAAKIRFIRQILRKVRQKADEAIEHGIPILYILSNPWRCFYDQPLQMKQEVFALYSDFLGVVIEEGRGPIAEAVDQKFEAVFSSYVPFAHELIIADQANLVKGWRIPGTQKSVGGYLLRSKQAGAVELLLPVHHAYGKQSALEDLSVLIDKLKAATSERKSLMHIPAWTSSYRVVEEHDVFELIEKIDLERKRLDKDYLAALEKRDRLQHRKLLFSSSGDILEGIVEQSFDALGFLKLDPGTKGRVDRIFSADGLEFICEIKGVSKSPAEKHLSQLMKWSGEYLEANEKEPDKALLVINPYRDHIDTPDGEVALPENVLKTAIRHEYGIVTGLQLFCAWYDVERGNVDAKDIRDELSQLVGVWARYENWRDFVEEIEIPGGTTEVS